MRLRKKIFFSVVSLLFAVSLFAGYQNAFANGVHPLVETQWLEDNLNKSDIRIVFMDDWPSKKADFDSKHIPGSVYIGVGTLMGTMGNGSAPPNKAKYEAFMSELGINKDDHVVLYSMEGKSVFTLGAFWLMEYFGHKKVSYLNGGLAKWYKENRPATVEVIKVTPTKYMAGSPNESIRVDAKYVLKSLKNPNVVLVDTRGTDEYIGENNKEKNKRVGHIPGALDLGYYVTNFNQKDGTVKSADDLTAVYEKNGVTRDKEVISYCQGGIKASNAYFILKHILGYPNVKVYVGSWGEWGNRVDFNEYPIEK